MQPADTADDLDRKMIAAVARAETADPSAILLKVFAAVVAEGGDLGAAPQGARRVGGV